MQGARSGGYAGGISRRGSRLPRTKFSSVRRCDTNCALGVDVAVRGLRDLCVHVGNLRAFEGDNKLLLVVGLRLGVIVQPILHRLLKVVP